MKPAIHFDFTHLLNKFSETQLHSLTKRKEAVKRDIKKERASGKIGFLDLPYQKNLTSLKKLASAVRKNSETLLVIGIGGSTLGAKAAIQALSENQSPRVLFLENPNPDSLERLLRTINFKKTTVNVISKSGSTLETLSMFFIVFEKMKKILSAKQLKERIIITSEATDNYLTRLAGELSSVQLSIPKNVSGRFSVLSPVGLFPMAVSGIAIDQVLKGAAWVDANSRDSYFYGTLAYSAHRNLKKSVTVFFPYDERLSTFGDWFCQLWAESLAKSESSGPTPIKAIGAIDQHSLLQLFLQGPSNKWFTSIGIERYRHTIRIPASKILKNFSYLKNISLEKILKTEKIATEKSLITYRNPLCRLTLPELSAYTLGALFYHFELATTTAGFCYQVDPFVQPAVEQGKVWTREMLKGERA